jgi:molecular chaperone GrpE
MEDNKKDNTMKNTTEEGAVTEPNAVENTENPQVEDMTADPISELEQLQAELAESQNKYLRLYADFENYKRRTSKERIDLIRAAGVEVIMALLPVLDDFERAAKSMDTATDINALKEGVQLVHNKLRAILEQKGLKEMKAMDTLFDSELHDAITNIPAPSDELKGKVVDELQKGYYLNDKVIRHAQVVVGS